MKKLAMLIVFLLAINVFAFAQSKFPELDKIKQIKLLESTREDVKKLFDDDDEDSDGKRYSTEDLRIYFAYSDGDCLEEDSDAVWNVPEGKVVEINVIIEDMDKSKDLKIDLSKLERINGRAPDEDDEETEETPDDYVYYDKDKGISYSLSDGKIRTIKFTPLEQNFPALCNNEDIREFSSTKEWFLDGLKRRPSISSVNGNTFASVTDLALDKVEITAVCPANDTPENEERSDYTTISVETTASDEENIVLTYNYTVSGGKIIGQGKTVLWDLSGVKPGEYTITAGVDNGCGVCGQTKTEKIVVKKPDCPQTPKTKDLP